MISITRSRLRKAMMIAFDQLEPVGDLCSRCWLRRWQDVDLVRDPVGQQLVQP
jgi:hypothetical protein